MGWQIIAPCHKQYQNPGIGAGLRPRRLVIVRSPVSDAYIVPTPAPPADAGCPSGARVPPLGPWGILIPSGTKTESLIKWKLSCIAELHRCPETINWRGVRGFDDEQ